MVSSTTLIVNQFSMFSLLLHLPYIPLNPDALCFVAIVQLLLSTIKLSCCVELMYHMQSSVILSSRCSSYTCVNNVSTLPYLVFICELLITHQQKCDHHKVYYTIRKPHYVGIG